MWTSARQLQTCQNKALRAVLQVGNRYSSDHLHEETGIEWLGVQRAKTTCTEMYKLVYDIGPKELWSHIKIKEPSRVLRSNANITLTGPTAKYVATNKDFLIHGRRYWDMLDSEVQTAPSLWSFKRRLKQVETFDTAHYTNYKNLMYIWIHTVTNKIKPWLAAGQPVMDMIVKWCGAYY